MSAQQQNKFYKHKHENPVRMIEEGEEKDMIANEFSSDEGNSDSAQDDMEEFMDHEEEFEARQSISSRGRDTRTQIMPGSNRPTQEKRSTLVAQNYKPSQNYQPKENIQEERNEEDSGSEIEEIVDEKVVILDSDDENQMIDPHGEANDYPQRDRQDPQTHYEGYQEFENQQEEQSPYKDSQGSPDQDQYEDYAQDQNAEYNHYEGYEHENQQQDDMGQPQEMGDNYAANAYQNMDHSPIAENPIEEEMTTSPQYYEAPRVINPKIRKKFEGMDTEDKSYLIWEQERLYRKRIQRSMQSANPWSKPISYRDIDWYPTTNKRRAYYDAEKKPARSAMWQLSNSSSVPMLTPASKAQKLMRQFAKSPTNNSNVAAVSHLNKFSDPIAKGKNHDINNLFHQSSYQNLLKGEHASKSAIPSSYSSLNKESGRGFMTALDNRFANQPSVLDGRAKNFYSSQIF